MKASFDNTVTEVVQQSEINTKQGRHRETGE
jgi:hypothetical protein